MNLLRKEVIGRDECPLIYRWMLVDCRYGRIMVHHFLPNTTDPDLHDHPWDFTTFALRGKYEDWVLCPRCNGLRDYVHRGDCYVCDGSGRVYQETIEALGVYRRRAEYTHATVTSKKGCWTVVFTGPKRRLWGFWRRGKWFSLKDYEKLFGFARRCDE